MTQVLLNSVLATSLYVIVGLGFSYVYQTARFFNLAHGMMFTIGAYSAFFFLDILGLPGVLSVPLGIGFAAFVGYGTEVWIYRPLRLAGGSSLALLLVSLGIYVVLQNTVSAVFGDGAKALRVGPIVEGWEFLGSRITSIQTCMICACIVICVLLAMVIRRTRIGKGIRAVASDSELAAVCGVPSEKLIALVSIAGAALAGLAGILFAYDGHLVPTMGMNVMMMAIIAVVVGGAHRISGIVLGAALVASARALGAWYISSRWQDGIAFLVLLVFLLLKPEGILGMKTKGIWKGVM